MEINKRAERDELLAATVERIVFSRTGGRITELRVDVTEGRIVLMGRAATYYTKQLATQAALDAADFCELSNEIDVC